MQRNVRATKSSHRLGGQLYCIVNYSHLEKKWITVKLDEAKGRFQEQNVTLELGGFRNNRIHRTGPPRRGVLPIMAYTGRLRPKGVHF